MAVILASPVAGWVMAAAWAVAREWAGLGVAAGCHGPASAGHLRDPGAGAALAEAACRAVATSKAAAELDLELAAGTLPA